MQNPRRIYDDRLYVHFVTFSVERRRQLLDKDHPRRILLGVLNNQLQKFSARCLGFVIMPEHVHALLWFPAPGQLSSFMQGWKRNSSLLIRGWLQQHLPTAIPPADWGTRFWQRKYYAFEIYSSGKLEEKLHYIHLNPV